MHVAYAFDSEPEALLACIIDRADVVECWVRNYPVRLEIDTPAGRYRPDFVVALRPETSPESPSATEFLILEAKDDFRWQEPLEEARLKNRAAREWAVIQQQRGHPVKIAVALESSIRSSGSWAELVPRLQ